VRLNCNDKAIKTLGHIIHSGQLKCTKPEKAPSVDHKRQLIALSLRGSTHEYTYTHTYQERQFCVYVCVCECLKQSHQINHSMHLHKFSVGHFEQRQQIRRASGRRVGEEKRGEKGDCWYCVGGREKFSLRIIHVVAGVLWLKALDAGLSVINRIQFSGCKRKLHDLTQNGHRKWLLSKYSIYKGCTALN